MTRTVSALCVFLLFGCMALPASAADEDLRNLVREMSAQLKQLNSRVGELESQLHREQELRRQAEAKTAETPASKMVAGTASKPAAGVAGSAPVQTAGSTAKPEPKPVTAGDIKGSFKIPGTDTSLAIGGYAKLDAIYNSVSVAPGASDFGNQLLIPATIPVGAQRAGEHSTTILNARESRFWLKSFTPTAWGDLNTYLEMDFYAFQSPGDQRTSNSYAPRLRHAYGSLGNFLAGQTWSTFMNVNALPELTDVGGPVGQIFMRQALVRWTQPFDLAGMPMDFQVAVENPETTLTAPGQTVVRLTPDTDRSPDLVGKLNYAPEWGSLSLAGLARQIRWNPQSSTRGATSEWGGAISLAGRVRTFEQDNIRFMLNYGNALGRYTSYNVFNDGSLDAAGDIHLNPVYAGFVSYQHWWNPQWRSNLVYGIAQVDNPAFVVDTASKQVQSVHLNLMWSPLLQTTFALEYIYASRSLENAQSGDLQRVQFSTRFNF